MTQRERHTPDAGEQVFPRSAAADPVANGLARQWEGFFPGISAGRQQELLALASHQGLLYMHQLGLAPVEHCALLPALLSGKSTNLEPLQPPHVDYFDRHLDDAQREAVARALHTTDICLIQGQPGTGKSRVVAEIVAQAVARGERVLLLAPGAAAVDCVLERIGNRDSLCPVRCLAADERPESLPACVRRLTWVERLRFFEEKTLGAARQAHEEARQQYEIRRRDEAIWSRLEATLDQLARLDAESMSLAERRDGLAAEVAAEADRQAGPNRSAFQDALAVVSGLRTESLARIDSRRAAVATEAEKIRAEKQRLELEVYPLTPLATAKRLGHWWTIAWWRASVQGDVVGRVAQLEKQIQELLPAQTRLAKEAEELTAERIQVEEQIRSERDEAVSQEAQRRRSGLADRIAAVAHERERSEADWQEACRQVGDATLTPTSAALGARRTEWERSLKQDQERCEDAAQWVAELEQALATFPRELAHCVNFVAATTHGLAKDANFGDGVVPPVTFDLLILEEAEQVTEADFLQAARHARRWVLVGEPQPDPEPTRAGHGKPVRLNALRAGFFQRLWRNLRWDPRRLPYSWEHRDEQLHCRLRPVLPEQERWVQTERLSDRPDVGLYILSRPRQEPELVEVVFPATTTVPEAKEYLFRELGEVTLQAAGVDWHWEETTERVVLRLLPGADPNAVLVPLCAGVRELVVSSGGDENDETAEWRTCAVEFDRSAGWDRARAQGWAADYLNLRDTGRSTLLTVTHRARPVLAAWLGHLLHGAALPTSGTAGEPAFEFVAVPSLASVGEPQRRGDAETHWQAGRGAAVATRLRSVKGGAGLETDLADSRRIDQIPADLRAALPPHGIVNFLEAQALIRCLEELLADDAFRAAAERWQQNQTRPCERQGEACAPVAPTLGRCAHCPTIAVIALYASQAELITRLLQRVPALLASPLTVEVGTPNAFRHRECYAVLVSLTRSHTHRAVPFGDNHPALALTRAAERVIVFGDPGTLARRSLWQGPLDHLDETAAEHERALAARIVKAIQESEAIPPGFRLREGNRV